jgi:hydroxymethylbilane synthase
MDLPRGMVLEPEVMVPAAAQGIIGITLRASDHELCEMLSQIEDKDARVMATAERALLAELDGSCRTPIGAFARLGPDGQVTLTGLVARGDGSFLLSRSLAGRAVDAARIGQTLGASLRADSPADLFD